MNMAANPEWLYGPQEIDYSVLGNFGLPVSTDAVGGDSLQALSMKSLEEQIAANQATRASAERANQPLTGFAKGAQTFGTISQGLASLGSIYLGLQGMKQQKKAFEFNKGVTNTNLNNSINDYNRRLNDTLTNRSLNNGGGQGYISEQLAKYSAKRS